MDAAIIGAGSALAGVALSQVASMLQAHLSRKHQEATLLRERLEELTQNLYQTHEWVNALSDYLHTESPTAPDQALDEPQLCVEARRVHVLSLLYFPTLKQQSRKLAKSSTALYIEASGVTLDKEKFLKDGNEFRAAFEELETLIEQEAKKIT